MGTNYSSVNDPTPGPETATGAADASSRPGETGGSAVQDAAQGVRDRARDLKEQAMQQGRDTLSQVKDRARSTFTDSRTQLADQVGSVAMAFRRTTEELRNQEQQELAQYADSLAGGVDRLSSYLRDRRGEDVLDDIERLARRQPGAFLGGAFALGLLAARFLRSSRPAPRYVSDYYDSGYDRQIPSTTSPSTPANYSAPLDTGAFDDRL